MSKSRTKPRKPISLDSPLVLFPKKGRYQLQSHEDLVPGGKVTISFEGLAIQNYASYDLSSFNYQRKDCMALIGSTLSSDCFVVAKETLPLSLQGQDLPPILLYYKAHPGILAAASTIIIQLNPFSTSFSVNAFKAGEVWMCNDKLQKEYQSLLPELPVVIGKHPIFEEEKDLVTHLFLHSMINLSLTMIVLNKPINFKKHQEDAI